MPILKKIRPPKDFWERVRSCFFMPLRSFCFLLSTVILSEKAEYITETAEILTLPTFQKIVKGDSTWISLESFR